MKDIFNYKNVVTFLIFITVWSVLFIVATSYKNYVPVNRYQIVRDSDNTILLDKQTGLTWRNTWNNNKDRIPCNWELMEYSGATFGQPIGAKIVFCEKQIAEEELDKTFADFEIEDLSKKDKKYIKLIQKNKPYYDKMKKDGYSENEIKNIRDLSLKSKPSNYWQKELKKYNKFVR